MAFIIWITIFLIILFVCIRMEKPLTAYIPNFDRISQPSAPGNRKKVRGVGSKSISTARFSSKPTVAGATSRYSKGERMCRYVLTHLFGKPFETIRPDFLKNPRSGCNLELDCYNADVKPPLAVEYNGKQHYTQVDKFQSSAQKFVTQVENDEFKKLRCASKGVCLITVPYTVPLHQLPDYLIKKLEKKGYASQFISTISLRNAMEYANGTM